MPGENVIERDAYLLAGPTASGKSAIAAELAREMGARILSADSMLVYRGMDIGTAKPPRSEIEEFGMGGVDVVTPAEEFSSGAWLRAAYDWVRGVPPDVPIVIVGGTGLYFSALLRGLDRRWETPPPEYPVIKIDRAVVRERIAARLDDMFLAGLEAEKNLHDLLWAAATPETTFAELHRILTDRIASLGFENADFRGNLGHSIASRPEDRIFIEPGNDRRISSVSAFTLEPHIRRPGSSYGFKWENIYRFDGRSVDVV